MAFPQDALARHVAAPAGGWEPQRQGSGVIQFALPAAVTSGDLGTIMLAVKTATLPVRNIAKATIPYLAGYSNVATKPEAPADFAMSVYDYVDITVYDVFHDWSQAVFDQRTGFGGFASAYKSNGFYLMFGPAAQGQSPTIIRRWELSGIFLLTQIPARALDYDNNDPAVLEYTLAVDDYQYLGRQGS